MTKAATKTAPTKGKKVLRVTLHHTGRISNDDVEVRVAATLMGVHLKDGACVEECTVAVMDSDRG